MSARVLGASKPLALPPLMCARSQADHCILLLQPEAIWVDNSAAVAGLLHRVLPSLKWVKEDVTHMMRQIMRELPRGHPMISEKLIHGLLMYCVLCLPASDRIVEQLEKSGHALMWSHGPLAGPFMDCLSKALCRIAPEEKAAYEERLRSQGVPEAEISSLRNSDFTRARYVTDLRPFSVHSILDWVALC